MPWPPGFVPSEPPERLVPPLVELPPELLLELLLESPPELLLEPPPELLLDPPLELLVEPPPELLLESPGPAPSATPPLDEVPTLLSSWLADSNMIKQAVLTLAF